MRNNNIFRNQQLNPLALGLIQGGFDMMRNSSSRDPSVSGRAISSGLGQGLNVYQNAIYQNALQRYKEEELDMKREDRKRMLESRKLEDEYLKKKTASMLPPITKGQEEEIELGGKKKLEDYKAGLKALEKGRSNLASAEKLYADLNDMSNALTKVSNTGYGILSSPLSAILPGGDTRADRQAVSSLGLNIQMGFTSQTKGAISDKEMAMFKGATPGLNQTPEANRKIINAMLAGTQRVKQKELFKEAWFNKYGHLQGAEKMWSKFLKQAPIIDKDFNVNQGNISNWQGFLDPNILPQAFIPSQVPQLNLEGRTSTNAQTGERLIMKNGQWQPI